MCVSLKYMERYTGIKQKYASYSTILLLNAEAQMVLKKAVLMIFFESIARGFRVIV